MPKLPKVARACLDCGAAFPGTALARWCPEHRVGRQRRTRRKYFLTAEAKDLLCTRYDSRVRGRTGELARQLGWPAWAVKRAAARLGLSRPWPRGRRAWTGEEEEFLREYEGRRSAAWLAKRLGRGLSAVVLKLKRLGLSRRVREGYTARDLAGCLGVDGHTVLRWVRLGWLGARGRGSVTEVRCGANVICRIPEQAVFDFVRAHPMEFRLDRVDQLWFIGLVTSAELMRLSLAREGRVSGGRVDREARLGRRPEMAAGI